MADKKITFEELCKQIKVMRPGAVMQFVSKQFGDNSAEFVSKHIVGLLGKAVKEGWTSAGKLAGAVRDFSRKNKEDRTKIDLSSAQIDTQTVHKSCLFDGKLGRAIAEFMKNFGDAMKGIVEDARKAEEKLESDAKDRGVDIKDEDLAGKELAVASVIDDKNNDGLNGDELKKKAISTAETVEQIDKIREESEKAAAEMDQKVKIDDAALKQAEDDIKSGKADEELKTAAKKAGKTDLQKKLDGLQKKIKAGLVKLVGKANAGNIAVCVKNNRNMKAFMKKRLGRETGKGFELSEARYFAIAALHLEQLGQNEIYKNLNNGQTDLKPAMKAVFMKMLDAAKTVLKDSTGKTYYARQALGDDDNDGFNMFIVIELDTEKLNETLLDEFSVDESLPEQLKFKDAIPMDGHGRMFSPSIMLKRLSDLDDMGDDGFDANELHKVQLFSTQLKDYQQWAIDNAASRDSDIIRAISQIKYVSNHFNEFLDDNNITVDPTRIADDAGAPEARELAKKVVGGKAQAVMEPAKSSWGHFFGSIGLTQLVWARVAMKTASLALKYGKGAVDAFGEMAVKRKEDANVIAEMTFIMENGDGSDMKFGDTKFGVRFDIGDMKWHATNLDDRKMKLPEDQIIKMALDSDEGRRFKQQCLRIWEQIVKPDDPANSTVMQILINPDAFGLKQQDSAGKFGKTIMKLEDSFDEIKTKFE